MKHKIITTIIFFCISTSAMPQLIIRGVVKDKQTSETLPGAAVILQPSGQNAITDIEGRFEIQNKEPMPVTIITSFIGYQTDTLRLTDLPDQMLTIKLSKSINLKQVEIKSRRESTSISTINTINTTTITQQELLKAACCNLSESFETNPTVDVNYSDAVTGAKQIHMLGLDGIYSQIQTENLPLIYGLSSAYGLGFTPGPWIESIQINKGVGSVINGYESITGQLNIELKKPQNAERFFINGYGNNEGRMELNLQTAHNFKHHISAELLAHGSMNNMKLDDDGDGFLNQPLSKQINLYNAWHLAVPGKLEAQLKIHALYDNRIGGQKDFDYDSDYGKTTFYGVGIENKLFEVSTKTGTINPGKPYRSLALLTSSRIHQMDNFYGLKTYKGDQRSFYANTIYQTIIHDTRQYIRSGLSFRYNHYSEITNDKAYYTNEIIPGAYTEYSYSDTKQTSLVAGLRADYHNTYGLFITPRLHFKYNFNQLTSVRLSTGTGWRTARIFAENTSIFASSRQVIIADNLKPERAWNSGINFTKKFQLFGHDAVFNADYYYTTFMNQVVVDLENIHKIQFYNLDGRSYSHYVQAEMDIEPIHNLLLRLSYKYNQVKTTVANELTDKALTPKDKALVNAEYSFNKKSWSIDATAKYTGLSRIPGGGVNDNGYIIPKNSKSFITLNGQLTKNFKNFSVYAGCENITGYTQKNPIIAADKPFSENFDASLIWGPLTGRMFYGGFRFTIK
ncbi:MAG: TonB-dependent receptor [Bacteroidetes bacterium]|nr:TonB-dependent receptor [Bacteroidota bacterium]